MSTTETKTETYGYRNSLLALLIFSLLTLLLVLGGSFHTTAQLVLDRYAAQLRAGHGLVFNSGERVLLIPAPVYMLLLAITGPQVLLIFAVLIGAISLFSIARQANLSPLWAFAAASLYIFNWGPFAQPEGSLPLMAGLSLLAFALALAQRWRLSGLMLALAILCSPGAMIFGVVLLLFAANQGTAGRYALALFVPLGAALLALWAYYGQTFWMGLLIFKPDFFDLFPEYIQLSVAILLVLLALWGWYRQRANPIAALLGAAIVLYAVIVISFSRSLLHLYGPISGFVVLLAVIGLHEIKLSRLSRSLILSIGLALIIVSLSYRIDPGPLLSLDNAKSVAVPSSASLVGLPVTVDQSVIALDGALQPDFKIMGERGDIRSALIRYAPGKLILDDSSPISAKDIADDAALARLYDENLTIRQPVGEFVDRPVNAAFGPDIRLVGIAFDQSTLIPGQLVRVRLDWQFARAASKAITVDLHLIGSATELAAAADDFDQGVFPGGPWSTYHTLTVALDSKHGLADLQVGVIIGNGEIARQTVTTISVTAR